MRNYSLNKTNKIVLLALAVFLCLGLILGRALGFNGTSEMLPSHEFTVNIGVVSSSTKKEYISKVESVLESANAKYETVSVYGEGDDTSLVIRYMNNLTQDQQAKLNKDISIKLSINEANISEHIVVQPSVRSKDFIYTATAIFILLIIACIFAWLRYNPAASMATLASSVIGTLGFISFASILRLKVGLSYLAILVLLNMLLLYVDFSIFEVVRSEAWYKAGDYSTAINSAVNKNKFRLTALTVALFIVALLFVLIGSTGVKYVSLSLMFLAVTLLGVCYYITPLCLSIFSNLKRKQPSDMENN